MMIFNKLIIKCENPVKLAQIRELLVEEDEYQREIFTMKKLLPLAEEKRNYERLIKYNSTWNVNNHGITQDVISELILDEPGMISFFYHSNQQIDATWVTVLGELMDVIVSQSEAEEKTRCSFDLTFYDMNVGQGSHYYWDGSTKVDKTVSYGLIGFAADYHPGLMKYLKIQDDEYIQEKQKVSLERQKNNSISKSQNHGNS